MESSFQAFRRLAAVLASTSPRRSWTDNPAGFAVSIVDAELETTGVTHPSAYIETIARAAYINVLAAGVWNLCGQPVISLGHRVAAADALTPVSADIVDAIHAPWPAFVVRLPRPMFPITDGRGLLSDASTLLVISLPATMIRAPKDEPDISRWWYKLIAEVYDPGKAAQNEEARRSLSAFGSFLASLEDGVSLWGFNLPSKALLLEIESMPWRRWETLPLSQTDARVDVLARQLVLNLCLRHGRYTVGRLKSDEFGGYTLHEPSAPDDVHLVDAARKLIATGEVTPELRAYWRKVAT